MVNPTVKWSMQTMQKTTKRIWPPPGFEFCPTQMSLLLKSTNLCGCLEGSPTVRNPQMSFALSMFSLYRIGMNWEFHGIPQAVHATEFYSDFNDSSQKWQKAERCWKHLLTSHHSTAHFSKNISQCMRFVPSSYLHVTTVYNDITFTSNQYRISSFTPPLKKGDMVLDHAAHETCDDLGLRGKGCIADMCPACLTRLPFFVVIMKSLPWRKGISKVGICSPWCSWAKRSSGTRRGQKGQPTQGGK